MFKLPDSEPAASVINAFRHEHMRILSLFDQYAIGQLSKSQHEVQTQITRATRTHLVIETGVLVPVLAITGRYRGLLQRAGDEYARIVAILNELDCRHTTTDSACLLMTQLRVHVDEHVDLAEGAKGLFTSAFCPTIAWSSLAEQISERRAEISSEKSRRETRW